MSFSNEFLEFITPLIRARIAAKKKPPVPICKSCQNKKSCTSKWRHRIYYPGRCPCAKTEDLAKIV